MTDSAEQTTKVSDPGSPDYDPHSPFYDVTADSSSGYYVGPLADKAASGDEIRAGAGATTDLMYNLFGWPQDALPQFKDGLTQKLYEQQLKESRKGLEEDLELRAPGTPPSTMWGNATHEQMEAAISQDADSAIVAESSEEWIRIGNDLASHQRNLAQAIKDSTANWQGEGGDAAREHLAGVGRWLGSTANGATLAGRQQQIHSQTLNETQKQMAANPPVPFNVQEANANLQTITNPYQYMSQLGKDLETFRKQQDARERAAQVMTQFDTTIGSAITTPVFPAPPKLPSAQKAASPRMAGNGGGGAGSPAMRTLPNAPEGSDTPQRFSAPGLPEGNVAASPNGIPDGSAGGSPGSPAPFATPGGPGGGSAFGGLGSGGLGSGGPGSPGGFQSPPAFTMPDGVSGEGNRPGSLGGPGGPGTAGLPRIDDTTRSSGFTPPSNPTPPLPNIPNLPDGGTTRTGSPFTPPPIPQIPNGPAGGPGPVMPGSGKMPTIGRGGGINGDSISSRLGGPLPAPEGSSFKGGPLGGGPGGGPLGSGPGGSGLSGSGPGGGSGGGGGAGAGGRTVGTGPLGGGSAVGAGAMDAEAAAARSAASGRSGAPGAMGPMGGGMGAGASRGQGDEDKEHKLADYLEPDDPSFFSADEVVAPPVIGDWKNKDWK